MRPGFALSIAGLDVTDRFRPRLMNLRLTEKRGDEADQLEISLSDHDGKLAFPDPGAAILLSLGFETLTPKGRFLVDEFEWGGPPYVLTIRARAADFAGGLSARRDRSWRNTTLGAVVADIAAAANLQLRMDPGLASRALALVSQSRESDLALLRRLGREHDAVATIKDGRLVFSPIGAGRTAGGRTIPSAVITRSSGDRVNWRAAERESGGSGSSATSGRDGRGQSAGVRAKWRDVAGGQTRTVLVGRAEGARTLSRIYASEEAAERAARAAHDRRARKKARFTITLAIGRPDLYPERPVTLSGFKPAIDGAGWLIEEVGHQLDDRGGLTTDLTLERR